MYIIWQCGTQIFLSSFLALPSGSGDSGGLTGSSLILKSTGVLVVVVVAAAVGRPRRSGVPSDRRPYTASVMVE